MNQSYGRLVSRAAIAATVMASCLLIIKIFAWWYTGSVSILAALVDSLVDIAASLTNLLVVRYSLQPADEEHTFGHGKAESLAALAQSMFVSGSALFLFLTGIDHLVRPEPMNAAGVGMVVTLIALVSYSAMAGVIGAGGLGNLAYLEGFQRNHGDVTLVATVTILIIVFIIQFCGDAITSLLDKR